MPIRIDTLTLEGGRIGLADHFIKPNYAATLDGSPRERDRPLHRGGHGRAARPERQPRQRTRRFEIAGTGQPSRGDGFRRRHGELSRHRPAAVHPVLRQVRGIRDRSGHAHDGAQVQAREPQARGREQVPRRPVRVRREGGKQGRDEAAGQARRLAPQGQGRPDRPRPAHRGIAGRSEVSPRKSHLARHRKPDRKGGHRALRAPRKGSSGAARGRSSRPSTSPPVTTRSTTPRGRSSTRSRRP